MIEIPIWITLLIPIVLGIGLTKFVIWMILKNYSDIDREIMRIKNKYDKQN